MYGAYRTCHFLFRLFLCMQAPTYTTQWLYLLRQIMHRYYCRHTLHTAKLERA